MKTMQESIYETAIARGLPTDIDSCIKHLESEIEELRTAEPSTGLTPRKTRHIESDKICMSLYNEFFKDRDISEIADMATICFTMAEELGEDLIDHILLKLRVNKLRA